MVRSAHTFLMPILAACIMLVSGCGTQNAIRLTISEDSKLVPTEVNRIEVRITMYSHAGDHTRRWGDYVLTSLPQSIVVNRGEAYDLGAKFWVDGFKDSQRRIVKYRSAAFPSGGVRDIEIVLDSSCIDKECEPSSHCESGVCVENTDPIEFPQIDADEEDEAVAPDLDDEDLEAEDVETEDLAEAEEVIDAVEEEVIDAVDVEAEEALDDPVEDEVMDVPPDPVEDEIIEDVMDAEDVEDADEEEAGCPPGPPLVGVESIAAGARHTCALMIGGGVKCWGLNDSGQLANETMADSPLPVDATGFSEDTVSAIALGHHHACAILDSSGGLRCWGYNEYGQLGDETSENRSTPVDVVGLSSGVISVAAGENHTCAVLDTGLVYCWGLNSVGQLGTGDTTHWYIPAPVDIAPDSATSVSTFGDHTCVLLDSGRVTCWGYNEHGQVGDGTMGLGHFSADPVAVEINTEHDLLEDAAAIAVGGFHTCVLTTTGGVKCWGDNTHGEIGLDPLEDEYSLYQVDVTGLEMGVGSIDCGTDQCCAVMEADGAVKCWGAGYVGQLGDGNYIDRYIPSSLYGFLTGGASVSSGKYHSCASFDSGEAMCWGENHEGRLGNGEFGAGLMSNKPAQVIHCE